MRRVVPTPFPASPAVADAAAFGALIRAARTHRGLSLAAAAQRLGVSKQTVFDLEAARAAVGLPLALRAAHEFGVAMFAAWEPRLPARRLRNPGPTMNTKTKASDLQPGTSIGNADAGPADGGPSTPRREGGGGQQISRERGSATRSKKNPGKRPTQGGGSR